MAAEDDDLQLDNMNESKMCLLPLWVNISGVQLNLNKLFAFREISSWKSLTSPLCWIDLILAFCVYIYEARTMLHN